MTAYDFPKDKDYIFAVADINETYGGLTTAMLNRARLFSDKGKVMIRILTFNYNPDYSLIRDRLAKANVISKGIAILNMYDYLSGDTQETHTLVNPRLISIAEEGYTIEKIGNKSNYRYFDNGLLIKSKSFDPISGKLKSIDYFNSQLNKTSREEYDYQGIKRRVTYFDRVVGQKKQELYFDEAGRCYLTKWFTLGDKTSSLDKIYWFDENKQVKQMFANDIEMRCYWMMDLIQNRSTFLFADTRSTDPSVLSLKGSHITKIFITHSIHVRPPFEPYSEIRTGNLPVLNHAGEPDAIVYLTHAQKADIDYRFGNRNNLFVIPHSYEGPKSFPDFSKRDLTKAVIVSRYHKEKQLDHAIKAFAKVINTYPDVKLEIYGFGPDEKRLQQVIESLDLMNQVVLMGKIDQADQVFESAAFSLVTSKYEGFGLGILESQAHGCPVLAYDIKYGPHDLIDHDDNGVLIKVNDQSALAKSMIDLFSRPDKLERMSLAAYKKSHDFNDHAFMKRWAALLQTTIEQRVRRNHLSGIDFYLTESDWASASLGVYKVIGTLTIHGDFPKQTLDSLLIQFRVQHRDTKESLYWEADAKRADSHDLWDVTGLFPTFQMYHHRELPKGPWDITIAIRWENSYFEKRIGYQKSSDAGIAKASTKTPHNMIVQPYYTNPYGNLTFQVKDNIVQKIMKHRGQAFNKLAEWINGDQ